MDPGAQLDAALEAPSFRRCGLRDLCTPPDNPPAQQSSSSIISSKICLNTMDPLTENHHKKPFSFLSTIWETLPLPKFKNKNKSIFKIMPSKPRRRTTIFSYKSNSEANETTHWTISSQKNTWFLFYVVLSKSLEEECRVGIQSPQSPENNSF